MQEREVASRRQWWALGVLSLAVVVIGMDNLILNLALPTLVRELQATASELQWMVDAYVVVFAGLLLTMGAVGDRFGRKCLLTLGASWPEGAQGTVGLFSQPSPHLWSDLSHALSQRSSTRCPEADPLETRERP